MSEFYPTTTCTLYTTFIPMDDYDEPGPGDNEVVAASGVPIQILTQRVEQFQLIEMRQTTSKTYAGRIRGHVHVELNYRILDERTGERYMIDDLDMSQNPLGDDSWYMTLRKVPSKAGQ